MDEKIKEYTMDDLEDIIREYSSRPAPATREKATKPAGEGATVRFGAVTGDTVRLTPPDKPPRDTKPLPDLDEDVKVYRPARGEEEEDVRVYQPAPKKNPSASSTGTSRTECGTGRQTTISDL